MAGQDIKEIIKRHGKALLAIPGVAGVAEGKHNRKPCILVFVAHRSDELVKQVPSDIEGYPVRIEESGEFKASGE